MCYALYLLGSGEMVARVGSLRLTPYATLVACALWSLQFVMTHHWQSLMALAPQVWGLSFFNAVFCTVIPVFATMLAIARIGAARVSLMGMLGPVSTVVLGTLVLNEPITGIQLVGTSLVLSGIFLATRRRLH